MRVRALTTNSDLLGCCVAFSESFKKFQTQLGGAGQGPAGVEAMQSELAAMPVELEVGMRIGEQLGAARTQQLGAD